MGVLEWLSAPIRWRGTLRTVAPTTVFNIRGRALRRLMQRSAEAWVELERCFARAAAASQRQAWRQAG